MKSFDSDVGDKFVLDHIYKLESDTNGHFDHEDTHTLEIDPFKPRKGFGKGIFRRNGWKPPESHGCPTLHAIPTCVTVYLKKRVQGQNIANMQGYFSEKWIERVIIHFMNDWNAKSTDAFGCGELNFLTKQPFIEGDEIWFGFFPSPEIITNYSENSAMELIKGTNKSTIPKSLIRLKQHLDKNEYRAVLMNAKKNDSDVYRVQCMDGIRINYSNPIQLDVEGFILCCLMQPKEEHLANVCAFKSKCDGYLKRNIF
ncbi:hypothetical protein MAR_021344 [Mya arenaria]|uniref:Uncharacterized protein n=1 Tax=Mya arenaria TaxID=6604 RepID=A0ABY7E7G2_MYAAR|nr:hypothetical protein MAR_021344 [Mya arenaria]